MSSKLFDDLRRFVADRGVRVLSSDMDIETAGIFDGLTITINPKHDQTAASYYLVHSFGSIVLWSTAGDSSQRIFDDLRARRARQQDEPAQFEEALARYLEFEQISSEHAVWVLEATGHSDVIPDYTIFFRADMEAMAIFHRTGKAPRWPDFFADWRSKVATGEVRVEPFVPRAFSPFQPVQIEQQEVLQERD